MKSFNAVKVVSICLFMFSIVSCGTSNSASNTADTSNQKQNRKDARLEARQQLIADLNLRDDQKTEVQTIVQESQEKMQSIRNGNADRRSKIQEIQTLSSETDIRLRAILDDGQFEIYQEFKQKQREEMRAQMQNRGGRRSRF